MKIRDMTDAEVDDFSFMLDSLLDHMADNKLMNINFIELVQLNEDLKHD